MSYRDSREYWNVEDCEKNGLIHLASLDESAAYEVDENHVFYDPEAKDFILRSASGCSCWDGEYGEVRYPTLDALDTAIQSDSVKDYAPTLKGGEQLIRETREAFAKKVQC